MQSALKTYLKYSSIVRHVKKTLQTMYELLYHPSGSQHTMNLVTKRSQLLQIKLIPVSGDKSYFKF